MASFGEVVRARARRHGSRDAYLFLADGERVAATLDYRRLAVEVRRLARRLAGEAPPGERALLVYPPGLEFVVAFLACLEAGLVAVPVHPPRPRAGLGALPAFAADATPRLLLGPGAQLDRLRRAAGDAPPAALAAARWLTTELADGTVAEGDDDWRPPPVADGDLAFLQYTSGSTAAPKGVMVTHGNLAANEAAIEASFGMSEESVVVSWLPPYHDMGLIGTVLQPLWCGGTAVLMAPLAFLQRPRRWLEAVTRWRATTTGGPDFAYALTERRVGEDERDGLDLSTLTVAFSGAEPVRPATLERFHRAFAGCGLRREALYPCYGLAEATLFVSGGRLDEAPVVREVGGGAEESGSGGTPVRRLTGCGRAWAGEEIAVADPESGRRLPPGREGEIRVAGPSVARGYWGRGEATRHAFREPLEPGGRPFLRTGDLGFLDAAGELFVSGRLKDLIVVRGRNLYPQDLEAAAEAAHPALRPAGAAAFGVEVEGEERVVVAVEIGRREEAAAGEAAEAVRRALVAEHEVAAQAVLVLRAGELPRTTSGKVRRQPCRGAYLAGELKALAVSGAGIAVGTCTETGVDGGRANGVRMTEVVEAGRAEASAGSERRAGEGSVRALVMAAVEAVIGVSGRGGFLGTAGGGAPGRGTASYEEDFGGGLASASARRHRPSTPQDLAPGALQTSPAGSPTSRLTGPPTVGPSREVPTPAGGESFPFVDPLEHRRVHLDSLQAVEVAQRLERACGVAPPLSLLLSAPSVDEVVAWLEHGGEAASAVELPEVAVPVGSRHPLAVGQRALLLAERLGTGERQTVLACAARLRGVGRRVPGREDVASDVAGDRAGEEARPTAEAVRRGLLAVAERHPTLRFTFPAADGEPVQVAGPARVDFAAEDATGWSDDELRAALDVAAAETFDLAAGPPLRARWWSGGPAAAGGADGLLLLAVHHVVADFASLDLLLADLLAELAGPGVEAVGTPAADAPAVTYASFVAWQREWLASVAGREAVEWWRRELAGLPPVLDLPTDRPRPAVASRQGAAVRLRLDADRVAALAAAARRADTTPFAWATAVWQALLGRWAGARDLAVATAVAGRPAPELADVAGHFVNLLPLRSSLGATTWRELAAATGRRLAAALDHRHLPFPRLVEVAAPPRDPSRHPLAQAGVVLESPRRLAGLASGPGAAALVLGEAAPAFHVGGQEVEPVELPRRTAELDLLLMLVEDGDGGLAVALEYATALFDAATAERLLAWWSNALAASLERTDGRWTDTPVLSPAERRQVLAVGGRPAPPAPLVHRAFLEHARRDPDAPAVVHLRAAGAGAGSEAAAVVPYGELADRVDELARRLVAAGVGLESRVGVLAGPTPARVVAVLAVLRAGGCFLALEPDDPSRRHADLLAAAGARHLVGYLEPPAELPAEVRALHLDADGFAVAAAPPPSTPLPPQAADHGEAAAYLVFTSGSTGRPKGVVVPHRAIAALAATAARDRHLGPAKRHLHMAALSFDISIGELLMPLATGAAVALADGSARRSGVELARQARLLGVTHSITTPAILDLVPEAEAVPLLADVCVGGEPCPLEVARRWVPIFGSRGGALRNGYGPAETTVHSSLSSCPPGEVGDIRHLGRPNAGTRLRVVDLHGGDALPGAVGELRIGGPGLARGYLGRPAATAVRFVPDPEAGRGDVPAGALLYRTGDLVRRGAGGELTFAGRVDHQLKVRGVRVEPGEVEAALAAHPAVTAAAVDGRGERLVAWMVAQPVPVAEGPDGGAGAARSEGVDDGRPLAGAPAAGSGLAESDAASSGAVPLTGPPADDLRRFLAERLPAGMVPDRFVAVASLPLTANGKLDREALPWPVAAPEAAGTDAAAASTPAGVRRLEELVARLWAEELDLEAVPRQASFFDLGGHSLALARIHPRMTAALGREVPLPDLFGHATVASLAAHLAATAEGAAPASRPGADERAAGRRAAMQRRLHRRHRSRDQSRHQEAASGRRAAASRVAPGTAALPPTDAASTPEPATSRDAAGEPTTSDATTPEPAPVPAGADR